MTPCARCTLLTNNLYCKYCMAERGLPLLPAVEQTEAPELRPEYCPPPAEVTIAQMNMLVILSQHTHISKAAAAAGKPTSNFRTIIERLERNVGYSVYEWEGKGRPYRLTPKGQRLVDVYLDIPKYEVVTVGQAAGALDDKAAIDATPPAC